MLLPTLQTPSQLSKHRSLQELVRMPDFHSLETIVLQHFCIPSKYKEKGPLSLLFDEKEKAALLQSASTLCLFDTPDDLLWGSRGPAMSTQHLTLG